MQQKVFTQDIDNFWVAFDSIQATKNSLQQLSFIRSLYIDKGTEGLKAFMKARDYTAEHWVNIIKKYPKFWNSIRPNTLAVKAKAGDIEQSISKLKSLYPGLKDAKMYFTIGGLRAAGTTTGNLVLIGTEIAAGDATTDASELPGNWLAGVFKEQSPGNVLFSNLHEYIHTQQTGKGNDLLAQSVMEGACDFIAGLVMGVPLQTTYMKYGLANEEALKKKFKQEMLTRAFGEWLYNAPGAQPVADLGYFMGYQICKSFYENSRNKKKATREIIELNYSDRSAVVSFLKRSKYYTGK